MLLRREMVTLAQAHTALYGARGEERGARSAERLLVHLRRNLAARGVKIANVYGVGWRLAPEVRARLRAEAAQELAGSAQDLSAQAGRRACAT